jgi:hypothetical protein
VKALKAISNPALIKRSWERCAVGEFNLSWESLTSVDARRALFALRTTDPALWAELSQPRQAHNSDAVASEEDDSAALDTASPFADDGDNDDYIDSAVDVEVLIQQIIAPSKDIPTSVPATGLSEELDPGEVVIPQSVDLGRGKRLRKANKLYAEFVEMSDEDEAK